MSFGYTLAFVWGLAHNGVIPGGGLADALHIAPDELVGAAILIGLFPAALFVTWASDGRAGVRILLRRALHWRVSPWSLLTVLLGLPTLTVGLALLLGDNLRPVDISSLVVSQLTLLLVNFIVTNLWEETAWTGCSRPGSKSATSGSSPKCWPPFRSLRCTFRCSSSSANR